MLNSLIKYEQIITTLPKAKELKPQIDKVITIGKKNILSNKKDFFQNYKTKVRSKEFLKNYPKDTAKEMEVIQEY